MGRVVLTIFHWIVMIIRWEYELLVIILTNGFSKYLQ